MPEFTLIVPYYRNPLMLKRQLLEWHEYAPSVQLMVIDDGSPEPALKVIREHASEGVLKRLRLYRVNIDIPWNREGARNLGAREAQTDWIVHVDIDHILPADAAQDLLTFSPADACYRFSRWRCGKADDTRRKDQLPDDTEFGRIHPHVDSYLMRRDSYWEVGGYDEDFSGCLGGGSDFLGRVEKHMPMLMLPEEICLHVYTRSMIADASDWSLSRDTAEGKRRAKSKRALRIRKPKSHVRFPWQRLL